MYICKRFHFRMIDKNVIKHKKLAYQRQNSQNNKHKRYHGFGADQLRAQQQREDERKEARTMVRKILEMG